MAKLKLKIHPLFFALGLYYVATGKIFFFLAVTLSALAHETAHAIRAEKLGYRLDQIVLMPYGAVVGGEVEELRMRDQTAVCLAGPLFNLAVALVTMGLWWVFPWLYAYTDLIVTVNLSLALVNLIPAYPLDGGRIFLSLLHRKFRKDVARRIALCVSFAVALACFIVFLCGLKHAFNPTALLFAVFLAAGALGMRKGAKYVRIRLRVSRRDLMRGKPVFTLAVSEHMPFQYLLRNLDAECLNQVLICYDDGKKRLVDADGLSKMIESADIYATVGEIYGSLLQNHIGYDTIDGKDETPNLDVCSIHR